MLWFDEKSISNVPPVMWLCLHISIFFSGYVHMQNKNDESKRALKCHFESLKWSREDRSFKKLDWNLDFFECRYFLNLNPYLDTVVKILAQILPARKSPSGTNSATYQNCTLLLSTTSSPWNYKYLGTTKPLLFTH